MYVWAPIPEAYKQMGSLEFSKKLLIEAKVAVAPGTGFGHYGDDHVRFAMIENEARTRQAVQLVPAMQTGPAQARHAGPRLLYERR